MIKAKFMGKDKSMGFRTGKIYYLKSKCKDNNIIVSTIDNNLWCPYSSIESFLDNWKLIKL